MTYLSLLAWGRGWGGGTIQLTAYGIQDWVLASQPHSRLRIASFWQVSFGNL